VDINDAQKSSYRLALSLAAQTHDTDLIVSPLHRARQRSVVYGDHLDCLRVVYREKTMIAASRKSASH